nr:metallo-beta-lactamase domain protein [Raoultella sp. NCTC 9187]
MQVKKFLIDPMLADKAAWPGFAGTARSELRNPLVALPYRSLPLLTLTP